MKTYFTTTFQARCKLAASYVKAYNAYPASYWIAFGKNTSWLDDNNPPQPALTVNRVPELLGFTYVHTCKPVYPDANGIVVTASRNYTILETTEPDLLASAKANRVYFESILLPNSLPLNSTYRIKALCTDVVFANPPNVVGSGLFVPASQVISYFVDWIAHLEPIVNDGTTNQVIQIVREF
jgi:hypothetical protein